ncbi:MAG: cysteine synthase family protein [Campylobacteraceae bacterium]|nr:cysteine synthase family protein [Campylobacteraceae bacterium]
MSEAIGNILDLVGNTPLIELKSVTAHLKNVKIYAKAEYMNPSGSVKDRAARAMILHGIKSKAFTKDKILIDATSGNTGISYAMMCAHLGYKAAICVPKNANLERKRLLKAFGAQIIETDPLLSSDGAVGVAKEIALSEPEKYFYPNQYANEENPKAHYNSTGIEIWRQSGKKVTHFVAGAGTAGTFTGTSSRLKEFNKNIKTILMQPDSPFHALEGMKHLASSPIKGFHDESLVDEVVEVNSEEAHETALRLARDEGLFVGFSSGGNVSAALKVAQKAQAGSVIVTILCDNGFRYLTDDLWEKR